MKVVINKCFGGFGLSALAQKEYLKLKGKKFFLYKQIKYRYRDGEDLYERIGIENAGFINHTIMRDLGEFTSKLPNDFYFSERDIKRDDLDLIKVIEKLGDEANNKYSELSIVEIPDGVNWEIEEYDGMEHIAEKHNTWS
jgi:hypothetical protein